MQKAHSRIYWENLPSINTPLGANNLNKMDNALDVIDDRVLSLYGYEGRVAQSEINAKASETNAKQSELLAKEYMENAFSGTPEGYAELVDTVGKMDIKTTTDTTLLNSKSGGYKLLSLSGNSVQNGTPTPDAPQNIYNVGDCVDIMQGAYDTTTGEYKTSNNAVCSKYPIPCKSGDVIAITSDSANTDANHIYLYYNESGFIKADTFVTVTQSQSIVPSGAKYFHIYLSDAYGLLLDDVGKISLTINGKYVVPIRTYDDNGNETVATVLLNAPLRESDVMSRTEVVRKRAKKTFADFTWVLVTSGAVPYFGAFASDKAYGLDNLICDSYAQGNATVGTSADKTIAGRGASNEIIVLDSTYADVGTFISAMGSAIVEYGIAEPIVETLDATSQMELNKLETFDTVTYINVDSRVQPSEIKGEYGTSIVGARTIKNELKNDTLEIKYNELANVLLSQETAEETIDTTEVVE